MTSDWEIKRGNFEIILPEELLQTKIITGPSVLKDDSFRLKNSQEMIEQFFFLINFSLFQQKDIEFVQQLVNKQ